MHGYLSLSTDDGKRSIEKWIEGKDIKEMCVYDMKEGKK